MFYLENNADLVVNSFLSLGSEKYSIEEYFEDLKLLPIGDDAFGNLICISYASEKIGEIFTINHEVGDVKPIASSLNDLLANLRVD